MTRHDDRVVRTVDIVGIAEIAVMLDVYRSAVSQWPVRHADTFPEPIRVLSCGPLYDSGEILRWARTHGTRHTRKIMGAGQ